MWTGINGSKTLTKYTSCKDKCKNVIQINVWIVIKLDVSVKNIVCVKKDYICTHFTYSCKNGKYLMNIIDDSVITCDKAIDFYNKETKTIPANYNEKKVTYKK